MQFFLRFVVGLVLTSLMVNSSLEPNQLALLINDDDPYSVEIGEYYRVARHIPDKNVIHVAFNLTGDTRVWPLEEFQAIKTQIDTILNATAIQAIAIAWVYPSAVQTSQGTQQSITSAMAYGIQPEVQTSCSTYSYSNPIYNQNTSLPWSEWGIRPAMMLGGFTVNDTLGMIDRGVASDGTYPHGRAYVLLTSDSARSVRSYGVSPSPAGAYINVSVVSTNALVNTTDCIYYCAGTGSVDAISTNVFVPGAIGDHLTSYGGAIPSGFGQMCLLSWIQYGMTGSYGTVAEPCNYLSKFPSPNVLSKWYGAGDTLIEAYWKSVAVPYQGLFVGEPLARPYGPVRVQPSTIVTDVSSSETDTEASSISSILLPSLPAISLIAVLWMSFASI